MTTTHLFTTDTDRCACGGEWVWFDPEGTHGCEVAGPYVAAPAGLPLDHQGRARCAGCHATDELAACDGYGVLCLACAYECPCAACATR